MSVTIQTALFTARQQISHASDSAALDAQVLLTALLNVDRAYLLAHAERILTADEQQRFAVWVERCASGEPLAYILGRRAFYDREFVVSPAVLVPRPETELLLERALTFAKGRPSLTAVDVGTGSGALAVTFAANCQQATVYAIDMSPAALAIARQNAVLQQANVVFYEGDLLLPLVEREIKVDLLMANLPYIPSAVVPTLAVSQHEPLMALDGGEDGLVLVRRLLEQAVGRLNTGALTLLEIGTGQGVAAVAAAQAIFPMAAVSCELDYAGHDRLIVIHHK